MPLSASFETTEDFPFVIVEGETYDAVDSFWIVESYFVVIGAHSGFPFVLVTKKDALHRSFPIFDFCSLIFWLYCSLLRALVEYWCVIFKN